jgi:uncharacterized protein with HEPN domain
MLVENHSGYRLNPAIYPSPVAERGLVMKDTAALLQEMLDEITTIDSYAIASHDEFVKDKKTQDAVMYNLLMLGEAAHKVPREFQEMHPEIPWSSFIGTKNVILHGDVPVKLQIVWDIILTKLYPLKMTLFQLLRENV